MSAPQVPLEIWKEDDDWTEIAEREERKKRQNRLNQRAYRKRNEKKDIGKGRQRPFLVDRFRITKISVTAPAPYESELSQAQSVELPAGGTAVSPSLTSSSGTSMLNQASETVTFAASQSVPKDTAHSFGGNKTYRMIFPSSPLNVEAPVIPDSIDTFPLSSDHLIHLIQFNVYRALASNKKMISSSTVQTYLDPSLFTPSPLALCDGLAVIRLTGQKALPAALKPTNLQMNVVHSSWLDMFPYSKVRDNLIMRQNAFNPIDFLYDLWGGFFMINVGDSAASDALQPFIQKDDEMTAGRRGLIVWGEPWDVQGYEATEGFVKKWFWVIEGCVELFSSTNFWRAKRGLEPLVFPPTASSNEML